MWVDAALVFGSYLLGSVPTLSTLARLRHVHLHGDFHASLWQAGRLVGVIGIAAEFAKGAIPVFLGRSLGFSLPVTALAGLAATVGQMWPVLSRFDGEKGNSIGLAMAMALVPGPTLVAIVPIVVSLIIRTLPRLNKKKRQDGQAIVGGRPSRSLPLGVAGGFLVLPVASWWFGEPAGVTLICFALFILIMIRRLTAGLRSDLAQSANTKGILVKRLLYDRPSVEWRQERMTTV